MRGSRVEEQRALADGPSSDTYLLTTLGGLPVPVKSSPLKPHETEASGPHAAGPNIQVCEFLMFFSHEV